MNRTHKVSVKLTYAHGSPYKWVGRCVCGWVTASWSWSRVYDCYVSTNAEYTSEDWIRDNGQPYGGAFVNSLEHVGLYYEPDTHWVPLFPKGLTESC